MATLVKAQISSFWGFSRSSSSSLCMSDLSDSSTSAVVRQPVIAERATAKAKMSLGTSVTPVLGPVHTNVAGARFVRARRQGFSSYLYSRHSCGRQYNQTNSTPPAIQKQDLSIKDQFDCLNPFSSCKRDEVTILFTSPDSEPTKKSHIVSKQSSAVHSAWSPPLGGTVHNTKQGVPIQGPYLLDRALTSAQVLLSHRLHSCLDWIQVTSLWNTDSNLNPTIRLLTERCRPKEKDDASLVIL